ncbi:hypothetical protein [Natronobiforma cellulositropha]|nr:hypothetical protein [Natronobiforma cellulositropha]
MSGREIHYPAGPTGEQMDRNQILALLFTILMITSLVAMVGASLF